MRMLFASILGKSDHDITSLHCILQLAIYGVWYLPHIRPWLPTGSSYNSLWTSTLQHNVTLNLINSRRVTIFLEIPMAILFDVIWSPDPTSNHRLRVWMSNFFQLFYMDILTYLCSNPNNIAPKENISTMIYHVGGHFAQAILSVLW